MDAPQNNQDEVARLLKTLPPDQVRAIVEYFKEITDEAIRKGFPTALEDAFRRMGFSEEALGLAHLLAARSNDTQENVLRKALTLYGVALDAVEKGNKLAVLSPTDDVVRDIVGIDSSELAYETLAK